MLNALLNLSLKNRVAAVVLTALTIVYVIFDTPIAAYPDLSENQALVSADWMGRGPQEIQDQVTYPLESAMRGLPKVKQVRSASSFGMSLITVIFEDEVEPYFARQVVSVSGRRRDGSPKQDAESCSSSPQPSRLLTRQI